MRVLLQGHTTPHPRDCECVVAVLLAVPSLPLRARRRRVYPPRPPSNGQIAKSVGLHRERPRWALSSLRTHAGRQPRPSQTEVWPQRIPRSARLAFGPVAGCKLSVSSTLLITPNTRRSCARGAFPRVACSGKLDNFEMVGAQSSRKLGGFEPHQLLKVITVEPVVIILKPACRVILQSKVQQPKRLNFNPLHIPAVRIIEQVTASSLGNFAFQELSD